MTSNTLKISNGFLAEAVTAAFCVLAILFDMNTLFERFVYAQLKREEARQSPLKVAFKAQLSRRFWTAEGMQKAIRPDIIARIGQ